MAGNFNIGDIVWAKMKGFPAWPAKCVVPKDGIKKPSKKKPYQFVIFFGQENYAWMGEEQLTPYLTGRSKFMPSQRIPKGFTEAVLAADEALNAIPAISQNDDLPSVDDEIAQIFSKRSPESKEICISTSESETSPQKKRKQTDQNDNVVKKKRKKKLKPRSDIEVDDDDSPLILIKDSPNRKKSLSKNPACDVNFESDKNNYMQSVIDWRRSQQDCPPSPYSISSDDSVSSFDEARAEYLRIEKEKGFVTNFNSFPENKRKQTEMDDNIFNQINKLTNNFPSIDKYPTNLSPPNVDSSPHDETPSSFSPPTLEKEEPLQTLPEQLNIFSDSKNSSSCDIKNDQTTSNISNEQITKFCDNLSLLSSKKDLENSNTTDVNNSHCDEDSLNKTESSNNDLVAPILTLNSDIDNSTNTSHLSDIEEDILRVAKGEFDDQIKNAVNNVLNSMSSDSESSKVIEESEQEVTKKKSRLEKQLDIDMVADLQCPLEKNRQRKLRIESPKKEVAEKKDDSKVKITSPEKREERKMAKLKKIKEKQERNLDFIKMRESHKAVQMKILQAKDTSPESKQVIDLCQEDKEPIEDKPKTDEKFSILSDSPIKEKTLKLKHSPKKRKLSESKDTRNEDDAPLKSPIKKILDSKSIKHKDHSSHKSPSKSFSHSKHIKSKDNSHVKSLSKKFSESKDIKNKDDSLLKTPSKKFSESKNTKNKVESPLKSPSKKNGIKSLSKKIASLEIPTSSEKDLDIPDFIPMCVSPKKNVPPTQSNIGFLGVGIMGHEMVKALLKSGHRVRIWNRTQVKCNDLYKEGALKGNTAADVVRLSDITLSCVSDPAALNELVFGNDGVLQEISSGKGYVDLSTIDLDTTNKINEAICAKGGKYLEAPICGSRAIAELGQLIFLVAGDRSLYEDCFTCFQAMGKKTFYLGEVGSAAKMKLVTNMVMGTWIASLAEAMALTEKIGLDQDELLQILNLTSLSSPLLRSKGSAIMSSKFDVNFALKYQQKDLRLAIGMADVAEQPLYVAASANELFKKAKAKGYGDHDVAAVYRAADM